MMDDMCTKYMFNMEYINFNTLIVFIFLIKNLPEPTYPTLRGVRNYERLLRRQAKLRCDLSFLLTCKKEKLTPNFAKPKLSIKTKKNPITDVMTSFSSFL